MNLIIKYTPVDLIECVDDIISSWTSTPYSICCLVEETRSHMILHTIPYEFSYLEISSLFFKQMKKKTDDYKSSIKELLLFNISTLAETFLAINNCTKVKDLAIEIDDKPMSKLVFLIYSLLTIFN